MEAPFVQRGAALVESILSVMFMSVFLTIAWQLGIIFYFQLNLDLAAHHQARLEGLSTSPLAGPNHTIVTQNLRPIIAKHLQDPTSTDADYSYLFSGNTKINNVDAVDYFRDSAKHTGGFSFTIPVEHAVTISSKPDYLYLGGFSSWMPHYSLSLTGFAIEPQIREVNPHVGIASDPVHPDAVDYFTAGDNTPPYFATFAFMHSCLPPKDTTTLALLDEQRWNQCPFLPPPSSAGQPGLSNGLRALGLAAHLDSSNDGYNGNGMALDPSYQGILPTPPLVTGTTGPFFESWCHRNFYLWIDAYVLKDWTQIPTKSQRKQFLDSLFLMNDDDPMGATAALPAGKLIYQNVNPIAPKDLNNPLANIPAGWDVSNLAATANLVNTGNVPLRPWYGCGVYR